MSTATQRKAWNEAMRSAGAVLPGASAAGASGAASRRGSGGAAAFGRASDRRRRRRDGARKSSYGDGSGTSAAGVVGGGGDSYEEDEREYRVAIRMDALEGGTAADGGVAADGGADDDDEYDEFAQLDDDEDGGVGGGGGGGRSAKRKRKARGSAAGGRNKSLVPKYLRPRSLASILIEEAGRDDSVAREYVNASVRRLGSGGTTCTRRVDPDDDGAVTTTWTKSRPPRKFCPVTGLLGEYTDPKSGIPYASLSALEQIRERPPPWMSSGGGGSANYWEAVKSLQTSK